MSYYSIFRWLPPSNVVILGGVSKRLRVTVSRGLFESAGLSINVEKGSYFGDGSQIRIGHRSGLGINSELHGPVWIGEDVMMGPSVVVYTENHVISDVSKPMLDQGFDAPSPVVIEDDVWIGSRVIILPGVTIGRGSVIGAGSVVTRSIPPLSVAAGNPCRIIRSRSADL